MSRFLLDTDHFTLIEHGYPPLRARILAHPSSAISTSIVTVEEVLKGRLASIARAKDVESRIKGYSHLAQSIDMIATLGLTGFDQRADEIFQTLKTSKIKIGSQDLKIASVALANSCILVTRNRRDFTKVPGLTIEDWSIG